MNLKGFFILSIECLAVLAQKVNDDNSSIPVVNKVISKESEITIKTSFKLDDETSDLDALNNSAEIIEGSEHDIVTVEFQWNKHFGNNDSSYKSLINLFDHYTWKVGSFASVSVECKNDMQVYLKSLQKGDDWAMKISDTSGKYRGLFFFENDFWLGSKVFCYEINRQYQNQPRVHFYVAKMKVASSGRLIHVGQCLPKKCTVQDVTKIMQSDPLFVRNQELHKQVEARLKIVNTRAVPGNVDTSTDQKFYIFGFIVISTILLVICATIYDKILKNDFGVEIINSAYNCSAEEVEKTGKKGDLNENESCEMDQINNNNNVASNNGNELITSTSDKTPQKNAKRNLGFASKLLLCFSLTTNAKSILSTDKGSEHSLDFIHGIRLITLMWIILVHTYLQMFGIAEEKYYRNISERSFIYQLVGNATFSVDTFFYMSGLLVVFLFLKSEQKRLRASKNNEAMSFNRSTMKVLQLVFYRFLRLTPVYLMIITFTELSVKSVFNNSVFSPGLEDHINCNKFWWRNILYINNFYPLSEHCLMWSWYLANDFQFYIAAIIILTVSSRFMKVSIVSCIMLVILSWVFTIYVSLDTNYTHKVAQPFESFDTLYDKPWQRFGPYAMGMMAGYVMHRVRKPPKVPQVLNLTLWSVSMFTLFIIIFGVVGGELSLISTSAYVSLGHTAWGVSLIWVTLSCVWKLSKPVDQFLSYKGFIPLSRLSYCAYLIHPTMMVLTSFQCDAPQQIKHAMIFTIFLGNVVLSFLASFICSVLFEAPVINILKLCLNK